MSFHELFPSFPPSLNERLEQVSEKLEVPADTLIIKEGQYLRSIPLVTDGLIKVFASYKGKELLLYYLQASESCIMTFNAVLRSDPSLIFALTERKSTLWMVPGEELKQLLKEYPVLNELYFSMYHERYSDLLNTITQSLFEKMDHRLLQYLMKRKEHTGLNTIKMTHQQIADELGTAREVISRILRKLEEDGHLRFDKKGIHLLDGV